jgi:hypothetical protein
MLFPGRAFSCLQTVLDPATSPQFKFGRSDGQHKRTAKLQLADDSVGRDLTGSSKFSIYFAQSEAATAEEWKRSGQWDHIDQHPRARHGFFTADL